MTTVYIMLGFDQDYVPVILMVLLIRSVTLLIALSSSTVELELE